MALSVQGAGQGLFATSRNQRPDILRQNPVFRPPTDDFSKSNLAGNTSVFREPEADDQDRQVNSSPQNFQKEKKSLFNAIPIQVRLGDSIERLNQFENAPPRGGNTLEVSGNNITVTNQGGESLTFNAEDNGRLIRTDDNQLILRNDTEEKQITLRPNASVTTEGSGQLTVFGEDSPVTLQAGQSLATGNPTGELRIRNPSTAETLQLAENNTIAVEGQRPNQTEILTLAGPGGAFIEFSEGETGTLTKNDDGTLTVTNKATNESVTFEAEGELSFGGGARGTLTSQSSGGSMTLERGQQFSLRRENGTVTVRNESSAQSTSIAEETENPQPSRPLQFQMFENLSLRGQQLITDELITRPQQEANKRNAENQKKRMEEARSNQQERNEEARNRNREQNQNRTTDSNNNRTNNSPFQRSNPSKFGLLSGNNQQNTRFGQNRTQAPNAFNQSSLQSQFNFFEENPQSSFSTTV